MPLQPPKRTVLVTGSAKRLGREIALGLAQAGWQVAVHYRDSVLEAIQTVADCSVSGMVSAAFDADLSDEASNFSFTAMEQHMRCNTGAAIVLAQALHTHVCGRNARGVVVNLLDQKLWNMNPDFLSYTLSKAALEAANTLLAMALAPQLRVVGVAPGLTLTSHLLSDEKFKALHKLSPLGRSSTPQDVASAVRFAIENSSITGTTLMVDGGQHLTRFERDFSKM
jgi:NAD(P)-dependent dehydrogenase (short-subunit alcohol dehydrogenase family)